MYHYLLLSNTGFSPRLASREVVNRMTSKLFLFWANFVTHVTKMAYIFMKKKCKVATFLLTI